MVQAAFPESAPLAGCDVVIGRVTGFLGRVGSEAQVESWRRRVVGNGCARSDDFHDSASSEHRVLIDELG